MYILLRLFIYDAGIQTAYVYTVITLWLAEKPPNHTFLQPINCIFRRRRTTLDHSSIGELFFSVHVIRLRIEKTGQLHERSIESEFALSALIDTRRWESADEHSPQRTNKSKRKRRQRIGKVSSRIAGPRLESFPSTNTPRRGGVYSIHGRETGRIGQLSVVCVI